MVSVDDLLDRRLLIISGKGGVGKTTMAAALGLRAARANKRVLICEVEGKPGLTRLFDADPLTGDPSPLDEGLSGMNLSAEEALSEYLEVQFHIRRLARPLVSSQLVYYVTHAAPGLRDILILGKVWFEATRKERFDLIILDTPAAGHAVSMLRSPEGFLHAVPVGPLANHARSLVEWLQNPEEVAVQLVSMPEEMPVTETLETAALLEEKLGMDVSTVLVNKAYSRSIDMPERKDLEALPLEERDELRRMVDFYNSRQKLQRAHIETLKRELSEVASIVELPYLFTEKFGLDEIGAIADRLEERIT